MTQHMESTAQRFGGTGFSSAGVPSQPGARMRKPISPLIHGALDYATSAAVVAAPRVMNFPRPARILCDSLASGYTGLAAVTDYPLSVRRVAPFKAHGAAELAIAAVLPAMPWLLGFSEHRAARNFCFALTGLTLVVAALTDWNAEDD
jgi:hypothetical protein